MHSTILQRKIIGLAIVVLILVGGWLRLYNIGEQSYWMDEGYTINAVLSAEATGRTTLDSGLLYACPTYCYPTAWLASHMGDTATSYRLLAAMSGIAFIAVIFLIASRFFSPTVGFMTTFFVTFSYWQIAWSRQARWYTLFELFFWLALFFFYHAYYHKKHRLFWIILTLIASILAFLTHGLSYLLPFIFVGWIAYDYLIVQKKRTLLVPALVALVLFGAVVVLDVVTHIDLVLPLIGTIRPHYELPYYLSFYLRTYWLFVPFVLVALFNGRREHDARPQNFLLFVFAAYLIPLSFLTSIVHYRYLFHVTPVIFLLAAVGIIGTQEHFKRTYQKVIFSAAFLALFFTMGGGVLVPQTYYYLESDNLDSYLALLGIRPHYAYTPQPDWNAAYDFIHSHRTEGDVVVSSMPQFNKIFLHEAGYWIKYDYLGVSERPTIIRNDREYYVGATVLDNLAELQDLTRTQHGYIVFDYMSTDGRIPEETLAYIRDTFHLVFHKSTNLYSEVWVYAF